MALAERGFDVVKFFPAEAAGGAATLKAWQAPLPDLRFCPTGGVTGDNAGDYLALANVACVGGSWVAPAGRVAAGRLGRHHRPRARGDRGADAFAARLTGCLVRRRVVTTRDRSRGDSAGEGGGGEVAQPGLLPAHSASKFSGASHRS